MGWDGNRIDKLGKMMYMFQFSTKVLQIFSILKADKNKCQYSKENFSRELQKDKSF